MLPCGLAAGMVGALPHAGWWVPCVSRRTWSAVPPITATIRAKIPEKLNALLPRVRYSRIVRTSQATGLQLEPPNP
jgi:hypothetical protein